VVADFTALRILQMGLSAASTSSKSTVGAAGIVVSQRHVGCLAALEAERHADDAAFM